MKFAEPPYVGDMIKMLERIATLERERDEARAAFLELRDNVLRDWANEGYVVSDDYPDRPEWRKGGE